MKRLATTDSRPHILLVGAGHAHLYLIRHRHRLAGADVSVVDPGAFWYSGMAAGVMGGRYSPAQGRIDPRQLARRYGATPLRGRLTGLDIQARAAKLADGRAIPFTLLSLNLGSYAAAPSAHPQGPDVWSVKPIAQLVGFRRRLEAAFRRGSHPRVVVVGAGSSGIELACNLRELAWRHGARLDVALVNRGQRVLEGGPPGASRWLARHLSRRGIAMHTDTRATGHVPGGVSVVCMGDQDRPSVLEADHVIYATGLTPPRVFDHLGLPVIEGRGLAIDETLQSTGEPDIFAAGDCAAMIDHPLPRLGVYGVRQAPVLLANLAARLKGAGLSSYVPQTRALAILDLGHGTGLAIRGHRWWAGRLSLIWKSRLDRRFMRQYRP
ncbi:NAD(P)/FAD-dependent oxidoreductase [Billgrantia endophytica]|uniref:Pyridine nucleotide-disulfide oxidoreductase n=1 Tax=Billgrantia endophytica TaxID=2033802 RepID=A0A2N7UAI2_9GAMM|nr:FAD-dependent oxidoreductase [Halomonas endophytica]PMR77457.1 pyridine nucleotide-disulfide oxidoreductase [Halomonas endophytica]